MEAAVFTGDLNYDNEKKISNYTRSLFHLSRKYSTEKELLEDARKRVVERRGKDLHVIDSGNFDILVIFKSGSLTKKARDELEEGLGVKILVFKEQEQIEEDLKESKDYDEVEADFKNDGDYKKIVPY